MPTTSRPVLSRLLRSLPVLLGVVALAICLQFIDLKGISTDEGVRLGIINGGHPFTPAPATPAPTYGEVLQTISPYAYQPAYYLLQNSLMRVSGRHDLNFFRLVNVAFLGVSLVGLLALTRNWSVGARVFLVGLFAFNAYLISHVLQIREYIVAVALYIWTTRLVLHLDQRPLERAWPDVAWFSLYGAALVIGFYVQTWTVFPALAQGAFLIFRRRALLARFMAHLGFTYLIVFQLTWPYLRTHTQKVNVGLWSFEKVTLPHELAQGFNLVLSGHLLGHGGLAAILPFAWLALVVAALVLAWRHRRKFPAAFLTSTGRLAWLLLLSSAVPLAFQIAYFYRVEPLSVWPRYFIIHYFFLMLLIGLAFRVVSVARSVEAGGKPATVILALATGLLAVSAVLQVRSYRRDPYFDTSTNAASNWPAVARGLSGVLRDDDVVMTRDFIVRSTLTATLPLRQRTPLWDEIEQCDLGAAPRLVYLESSQAMPERAELIRRLASRGYSIWHEREIPSGDGSGPLKDWRILTFSRP